MYVFVCVDDYLRFSWVSFFREKFDTFNAFKILFLKLMREKNRQLKKAIRIRSGHEKEFENSIFTKFCNKHGIDHKFFDVDTSTKWGGRREEQSTTRNGSSYAQSKKCSNKILGRNLEHNMLCFEQGLPSPRNNYDTL